MATKNYKYTGPKGTEVTLDSTLIPFADRMKPLVSTAYKASVANAVANRNLGEIIADVRMLHPFTPKNGAAAKAVTIKANSTHDKLTQGFLANLPRNAKGNYLVPASDVDWTGSGTECKAAEEALWSYVFETLNIKVSSWAAATNLPESDFPLRTAVNYHILRAIKARFLAANSGDADAAQAAYVVATGNIWEEPGKARTEAVAALETESSPKGETDVSEATKATAAKQDNGAILASVLDSLRSLKVKGSRGPTRVSYRVALNEINLQVQVLLSEVAEIPAADKRRVRAADAAS